MLFSICETMKKSDINYDDDDDDDDKRWMVMMKMMIKIKKMKMMLKREAVGGGIYKGIQRKDKN